MTMARELTRRTDAAPEPPEPGRAPDPAASDGDADPAAPRREPRHDPANAFARLSRAIRLTLALEARAEADLAALLAGRKDRPADDPGVAEGPAKARRRCVPGETYTPLEDNHPSAHRNTVRDCVYEVINGELTELIPAREMLDTLHERLLEGERYDVFIHRPLRETVAAICEDLGLHPDWSRWTEDGCRPAQRAGPRYKWETLWRPVLERLPERHRDRFLE